MARFKRHDLNDFDLEEELEERRSPQGAKFDRDDSVPKSNTVAGDPQRGGCNSSVADQQASSWSSSRTPFEPHQNLLIEAERQAILVQELARRGIGFPAAVANSHGVLSYPTGNDQPYRIQTGIKMNLATLKSQTANDQAPHDSGDCQWPPMRFFDNGTEVNIQGQPLGQLHGDPVQPEEKRPADESKECAGDFLPSN